MVKNILKFFILAILLSPSFAHAAANDIKVYQRAPDNLSDQLRTMTIPASGDGVMYYNSASSRPAIATFGSRLSVSGGVMNCAAQIQSDWSAVSGDAVILNKPTLFDGTWASLSGKPTNVSQFANDANYVDQTYVSAVLASYVTSASLTSTLASYATTSALTSGLATKDALGAAAAAQAYSIQRANHTGTQSASTITGLATVATSGSYNDLTNKPAPFSFGNPTSRSVSLATAYQCTNNAAPCIVTINVTAQSSISLSGTSNNEGGIWIGSTNAVSSGSGTQIGAYKNALGGALVIGLSITSAQTQPYTFALPVGWYFAVRQTSGTGMSVVSAFDQVSN